MIAAGPDSVLMGLVGIIKRHDLKFLIGPVTALTRTPGPGGTAAFFFQTLLGFRRPPFLFLRFGHQRHHHAVHAGNERLVGTLLKGKIRTELIFVLGLRHRRPLRFDNLTNRRGTEVQLRQTLDVFAGRNKRRIQRFTTAHLTHAHTVTARRQAQQKVQRDDRTLVAIPVNRPLKLDAAVGGEVTDFLFAFVLPGHLRQRLPRGKKPAGCFPAGSGLSDKPSA